MPHIHKRPTARPSRHWRFFKLIFTETEALTRTSAVDMANMTIASGSLYRPFTKNSPFPWLTVWPPPKSNSLEAISSTVPYKGHISTTKYNIVDQGICLVDVYGYLCVFLTCLPDCIFQFRNDFWCALLRFFFNCRRSICLQCDYQKDVVDHDHSSAYTSICYYSWWVSHRQWYIHELE